MSSSKYIYILGQLIIIFWTIMISTRKWIEGGSGIDWTFIMTDSTPSHWMTMPSIRITGFVSLVPEGLWTCCILTRRTKPGGDCHLHQHRYWTFFILFPIYISFYIFAGYKILKNNQIACLILHILIKSLVKNNLVFCLYYVLNVYAHFIL